MRTVREALSLPVAALLSIGSTAHAEDNPQLVMVWVMQAQQAQQAGTPIELVKKQRVVTVNLVSKQVAALKSAAQTEDGREVVPAGSQLALMTGSEKVACTTRPPAFLHTVKPRQPFFNDKNMYVCLVDLDRDGRFEAYFHMPSMLMSAFIGVWRRPDTLGTLTPTHYEQVGQDAWALPTIAEVVFLGKRKDGRLSFGVSPRSVGKPEKEDRYITYTLPAASIDADQSFEAFGSRYRLIAQGKSQSLVRLGPADAEPLMVTGYSF